MSRGSGSAGAMALREFVIDRSEASGASIRIVCRAHGLRALIRTMLRLDPYLHLNVDHQRVGFNQLSIFKEEYQTIPIRAVRSVSAGFVRPFRKLVAAVILLLGAFAWLLLSALWDWEFSLRDSLVDSGSSPQDVQWILDNDHWLVLLGLVLLLLGSAWQWWRYARGKQLFFEFEYGARKARGLNADRTVSQHVDLNKVREAVNIVSDLVTSAGGTPATSAADVVVDLRATEGKGSNAPTASAKSDG